MKIALEFLLSKLYHRRVMQKRHIPQVAIDGSTASAIGRRNIEGVDPRARVCMLSKSCGRP